MYFARGDWREKYHFLRVFEVRDKCSEASAEPSGLVSTDGKATKAIESRRDFQTPTVEIAQVLPPIKRRDPESVQSVVEIYLIDGRSIVKV